MILTVHDELLFEAPREEADADRGASSASGWNRRRAEACR